MSKIGKIMFERFNNGANETPLNKIKERGYKEKLLYNIENFSTMTTSTNDIDLLSLSSLTDPCFNVGSYSTRIEIPNVQPINGDFFTIKFNIIIPTNSTKQSGYVISRLINNNMYWGRQ